MLELFNVTTTIKTYHGCKDVFMHWFMIDRKTPVGRYAALIRDYYRVDERARLYAEGAVDELFTAEEADALLAYLQQHHPDGSTHVVTAASLPLGNGGGAGAAMIAGYDAIAVGGPQDFYMLHKEADWNLPFNVYGYYDLEAHEAAPGCEQERRRALRSGMIFAREDGTLFRASEMTDEEYERAFYRPCPQ